MFCALKMGKIEQRISKKTGVIDNTLAIKITATSHFFDIDRASHCE